jgi:hypothetical protein
VSDIRYLRCAGVLAFMLLLSTLPVSAQGVDDKQVLSGLSEVKVALAWVPSIAAM